jgi:hypothetical protein
MPNNYVLLEKIVVGSAGASSVTFANIPQTGYTDLVVKASARTTDSNNTIYLGTEFNGNSTGYSARDLYGTGSTAASRVPTGTLAPVIPGNASTASVFSNMEIYIPNYTSSNAKSYTVDSVTENNGTTAFQALTALLWSNTAAITSIKLTPELGSLVANSTFYLYGVAKLGTTPTIAPKATGGDVIDTDGTYWYHIFNSSGTFTPAVALSCDYLVVAGGGGGGERAGGGGGGGGLRSTVTATGGGGSLESALSLASGTGYTVTIGAGGTAGTVSAKGGTGSNSVFSTITSNGGGGGGTAEAATGLKNATNGGSGGGSAAYSGAGTVGTGTANQGFNGGTGIESAPYYGGGGGGGAGSVGSNGTSTVGGAGGSGVATSITGSSVTRAGGGGGGTLSGGTGGTASGGGGAGGSTPAAGTANTGGGGGAGGGDGVNGAAGGSGIVVVRYLVA